MDRSSFLASMPFLIPTCLIDFPRSVDYSVEVLLKDAFFLSIEPGTCKGPVYFAVEARSDPSICAVELAFLYRRAMDNDDVIAESAMFMIDSKKSRDQQSEYTSLGLMIRIDGHVYAVDVCQLRSLQIVVSREATTEGAERPTSLLLHFTACLFRIFSTYPDDALKLEAAKSKLADLIQKNHNQVWKQGLLFLDSSTIDSPSTTSTHHKESQNSSTTITTEVFNNNKQASDNGTDIVLVPAVVERFKKRRAFQDEFRESMTKLEMISKHLLDLTDGDVPHYRQAAYKMMTVAAKAQAKSFASPLDVAMAARHYESVAHDACQNVEQLLEAFFPSKGPGTRHHEFKVDLWSVEEKVSEQLLKRQKAATERTNLLLFPTRG